jgi:ATP-dependent DNA helicase DinG
VSATSPSALLAADGPLAQQIPDFLPRLPQQEMADAVAEALAQQQCLVCEAGTGTGKTFAYLVPALLCRKRVLISTGTKTLQEQLFYRDLPTVRKALAAPASTALLKGRSNYLCLYHLHQYWQETERSLVPNPLLADNIKKILAWSEQTESGEISTMPGMSDSDPVWRKATSTSDTCLGQECPDYEDCFLLKARQKAMEADVIVVNHHLLFADMSLRDGGFGEVLPEVDAVIIDEAHQLPEAATGFFGIALSMRQLVELCRDAQRFEVMELGDCPELADQAKACEQACYVVRNSLGGEIYRLAWRRMRQNQSFIDATLALLAHLETLETLLQSQALRSKNLELCYFRCALYRRQLISISQDAPDEQVAWFESQGSGYTYHLTPLNIAEQFQRFRTRFQRAWVFTSATLAVGEDFRHFCLQLGLDDAQVARWQSPFDFRHSALFFLPDSVTEPGNYYHTESAVNAAIPVLRASEGRAFFLFTSHRALLEAAQLLRLSDLPYPLFIQGELPRSELLEQFRQHGNAILLGTGSFWEGVDVRGAALSCVIIDKLPFAALGDPVLEARLSYLREQGRNPFMEYQLPQAVITLKQGMGRLIRDVSDRGLLMLCDPRVITKAYGRVFLDSLPDMPKTRSQDVVERFFVHIRDL